MADQKPKLEQVYENEWRFVFPRSMENEKTINDYYEGVELLGYDDAEAEKIFKKLIKKHPYHIDAYNHLSLAFKYQKKPFESFITAEKGYWIGKMSLPNGFKMGKSKLEWGFGENRPFLRSCHILGLEYQEKKQYREAIHHYTEALECNKGDNQGVRYLILQCLFAMGDFAGAAAFLKKIKDDWGIDFVYGRLLLAIINGEEKKLKPLLRDALEYNRHVPSEILKDKHIVPVDFDDEYVAAHSEAEAYEYWDSNRGILNDPRIKSFFAKLE
jgi:tetratricopeptide (TPR) repeat protein